MNVIQKLKDQPRWAVCVLAVALVVFIGFADYQTGYDLSVYVFYSIPILLVVFFVGRAAGLWISFLSAVVWSLADIAGRDYQLTAVRFWNASVQLLFFMFIVVAGAALKDQRDQSRTQVSLLERFHTLAQIAPVGIFRAGAVGSLIFVNERWRRIAGIEDAHTLPRRWTEAFHPDDRDRVAGEWARAIEEGRPCEFEARFQHRDGRTVWVLGRVAPEPDGRGGTEAYVGAMTDTTEQRRLEREVLEISGREQQRIGQDLHDDLCQELVAIQYAAATLKGSLARAADPGLTTASAEIVELLKSAVVRTRQLARRIFPVNLDQAGLMSALQELAEKSARVFNVRCRFECLSPVLIEENVTGSHLFRIAQEALNNAIRHAQCQEVVISLTTEQSRISLLVSDDGAGFNPASVETLGMGLNTMLYRARMIGAAFDVQSQPGRGTTVRCVLRKSGARLRERLEALESKQTSHAV